MPFLLSSTEVLRNRYIWTNWDVTSSKKNDFFEVFQLGLIDYLAFYFMNITHVQKLNHLQNFIPVRTLHILVLYLCESGRESPRSPLCSWRSGFDSHCEMIETECCPHRPAEFSPKPVKHIP